MRQSIDFSFDDHSGGDEGEDERPRSVWAVAVIDDCEGCADPRVEVTLEEEGAPGTGVSAHLSPATARRIRAALAAGLKVIGEPTGS